MKLALTTAAIATVIATSANAGLFDSVATKNWDTKATEKYKIEAYGYDMRIYEWNPEGNPNITCITGFSEVGSIGLQCFKTEEKKDRMK
mgnify:CR=1 FL=1